MKLQQRLVLWHRYLGIGCCLFFAMWFASGIVMMYVQMPALTELERLDALPPLALDRIHVSPGQALELAAIETPPAAMTLSSLFGRPVYRIRTALGLLTTVFADGGRVATRFDFAEATRSLTPYLNQGRSLYGLQDILTGPDQWTVSGDLDALRPFYRVRLNDPVGTMLYVSSISGDVVLVTTRRSRTLAWMGAIPHWLYLTALRRHPSSWRRLLLLVAGAGCAVCLLGLTLGVLRFSPSKQYRLRDRSPSRSPYEGVMRWHHWAGLVFGTVTFMWVFSGLLTLDPGRFSHGTAPNARQLRAYEGSSVGLQDFQLSPEQIAGAAGAGFRIKEVALIHVDGLPFYRVKEQPGKELLIDSAGARAPMFAEALLVRLARQAVPEGQMIDAALITDYDTYYYDRAHRWPLPVLRAKFDDPGRTWLYVDRASGTPVATIDRSARVGRWLSDGLHRLDFPFLWRHRPLWDVVTIALSAGGLTLSLTGTFIGFRRLREIIESRRRRKSTLRRADGTRGTT